MPAFYKSRPEWPKDLSGSTPVTVVVNHSKDGRLRPEYFRYIHADHSEALYKIEKIKFTRDYPGKILFCCNFKSENFIYEILLEYYINDHTWFLKHI